MREKRKTTLPREDKARLVLRILSQQTQIQTTISQAAIGTVDSR
jgi:hypothetical protein